VVLLALGVACAPASAQSSYAPRLKPVAPAQAAPAPRTNDDEHRGQTIPDQPAGPPHRAHDHDSPDGGDGDGGAVSSPAHAPAPAPLPARQPTARVTLPKTGGRDALLLLYFGVLLVLAGVGLRIYIAD
jgi:LPXTG-motif cell wall-anchored protein